VELEKAQHEYTERGIRVAALTYDSVEILENFANRVGITYLLLSDPESAVIRAFDILNDTVPADNRAYGVPFPGSYVVAPDGTVQAKFFEEDFRERYTASSIIVHHFGGESTAAKTVVDTNHLKLTASASNGVVRPGYRVTVELEVALKPGTHVYAPGVEGYTPIEWSIEESPGWQTLDAVYPESRMLHLPAIQETVPVYEGTFRVVRDVVIAQQRELQPLVNDGKLTLRGSFEYQACDDKICYRPETIPLEWTFQVEQLDRTRVPEELQREYAP